MAVLLIGVALFALTLGYVVATVAGDAHRQDLEMENRLLEIQVASLKRSHR